jgi:transposase
MMVLAGWPTPAAIRRAGADRIEALLRRGSVRNAAHVAEAFTTAARAQTVTLRGEDAAGHVVAQLATEILAIEQRIDAVDGLIAELLERHPLAGIVTSLPGMGNLLTAELFVHTGNLTEYPSPDNLAAHAGLAPVAHDSGIVTGNQRRPHRFHRRLRHIFWISAFTAVRVCPASRAHYDRKRAAAKTHTQSILALARRRVDVLWALVRDGSTYHPRPTAT